MREDNFFDLIDLARIAIFQKDIHGSYLFINRQGAQMLEAESGEIKGLNDFDFFAPSSAEFMMNRDREILSLRRSRLYDSVAEVGDHWKRFLSAKSVVLSPDGFPIGLIGVSALIDTKVCCEIQQLLSSAFEQMKRSQQSFARDFFAWTERSNVALLCNKTQPLPSGLRRLNPQSSQDYTTC